MMTRANVRTILAVGSLAGFFLCALMASSAFGQAKGYIPDLAAQTASADALLKSPLTLCKDAAALQKKLQGANAKWMKGDGLTDFTMVEYTNTYAPGDKPGKKEVRHMGCAYDRGVDWWIPTDIALNWLAYSRFYEGADGKTWVMLWEAEMGGEDEIMQEMQMCAAPGALPFATWGKDMMLTMVSNKWMYGYSLESVFDKETGLLLRERFVALLAEGGYVIGEDTSFEYGGGGYPEKATMRSIVPPGDEDNFGITEHVMTFEMIDGAWMMRRLEFSFYEPPKPAGKKPIVSVTQNDDIKVVKYE